MADVYICSFCDREVTKGQAAIECVTCCTWIHKGCTGLGKVEYGKIVSDFRKYKSHKWECKSCKKIEVKRLSVGNGGVSVFDGRESSLSASDPGSGKRAGRSGRSAVQLGEAVGEVVATGESEVTVKGQIDNLLKKTSTSNKDILLVISHIVNLLLDQRNAIQAALDDIREKQCTGGERIKQLESEVAQLKNDIIQLKEGNSSSRQEESMYGNGDAATDKLDVFGEIQERSIRSRNIMVFNVTESLSKVVEERVNHDKAQILNILTKLEVDHTNDFRVQRVGRAAASPRPLKVIFSDPLSPTACLRKKYKLKGSSINIKPDLTPMQRKYIKKLYEELDLRRRVGEEDLIIRFKNGNPFIAKESAPMTRPSVADSKNE